MAAPAAGSVAQAAPLMLAIVVAELPAIKPALEAAKASPGATPGPTSTPGRKSAAVTPSYVLVLPHGDASKLDKNVLSFCFPDVDALARTPFAYDHTAEEYTFTFTPKDGAKLYGFCRRYRVGAPKLTGRLDLTPYTSHIPREASTAPAYQCICILSERPFLRFFSQCLQLLHAARLAGGPVAMRLARTLLGFASAGPGAVLPLRVLIPSSQCPGSLMLPRERLRVPQSNGLPYFDVPLAPLLMRLDAPALTALYAAMLAERRIMFVSQSITTLTSCVHAAVALFQPFEWANIFIPVVCTPLLPYCAAPNPYLIGLTPAQFAALNEEYEVGEIVLVALDDGYVACLNGSQPLPDFDGASAGSSNSGTLAYSGPRLTLERAAARVGEGSGGGAATLDPAMTAFHAVSRSHAYDDDVVQSRAGRRQYVQQRMRQRAEARAAVAKRYSKQPPSSGRGMTSVPSFFTAPGTRDSPTPSPDAAGATNDWGLPSDFGTKSPGVVGDIPLAATAPPPPITAPRGTPVTPGGASAVAAGARRADGAAGVSDTPVTAAADVEAEEEMGTASLPVDLRAMATLGQDDDTLKRRRAAAARRLAAMPTELSGIDSSALAGSKGSLGARFGIARLGAAMGKMTMASIAYATGGPTSSCPCALLIHDLRAVYAREKKEGAFDEAAVYAAVLTFVAVVFGRVVDFMHVEGPPPGARGGGAHASAQPKFAKEEFVKLTARTMTLYRVLEEAQQAQWLHMFAEEQYRRSAALKRGDAAAAVAARHHMVDILMAEATAGAASGASGGSMGSSGGGSYGSGSGGPAALLGTAASFSHISKKLYGLLGTQMDALTDAVPAAGATGVGIAGTAHTASTALAHLLHSSACVSTFTGRAPGLPASLPEPSTPIVTTALRALLSAATSSSMTPEESPSAIVRIAAAATHDPHLIHVVLGVLWNRMNDCGDRKWEHGYKALLLLHTLLRSGSPRVMSLAVSFVPLLRYLMHPTRTMSVRAGYVAEELAGQVQAVGYIQSANVLARARKGMFGPSAIPGLTLSTAPNPLASLPIPEGAHRLAQQASRVYLLIADPRRWMLERALMVGPAALARGAPLTMPLEYPLVTSAAVFTPSETALPVGWMPTAKEPQPPSGSGGSDARADEARLPALVRAGALPSGAAAIQKQEKAAAARVPWAEVHRVATPCIASSQSKALSSVAERFSIAAASLRDRPEDVRSAIEVARERKVAEAALSGTTTSSASRPRSMREALSTPISTFGGVAKLRSTAERAAVVTASFFDGSGITPPAASAATITARVTRGGGTSVPASADFAFAPVAAAPATVVSSLAQSGPVDAFGFPILAAAADMPRSSPAAASEFDAWVAPAVAPSPVPAAFTGVESHPFGEDLIADHLASGAQRSVNSAAGSIGAVVAGGLRDTAARELTAPVEVTRVPAPQPLAPTGAPAIMPSAGRKPTLTEIFPSSGPGSTRATPRMGATPAAAMPAGDLFDLAAAPAPSDARAAGAAARAGTAVVIGSAAAPTMDAWGFPVVAQQGGAAPPAAAVDAWGFPVAAPVATMPGKAASKPTAALDPFAF